MASIPSKSPNYPPLRTQHGASRQQSLSPQWRAPQSHLPGRGRETSHETDNLLTSHHKLGNGHAQQLIIDPMIAACTLSSTMRLHQWRRQNNCDFAVDRLLDADYLRQYCRPRSSKDYDHTPGAHSAPASPPNSTLKSYADFTSSDHRLGLAGPRNIRWHVQGLLEGS